MALIACAAAFAQSGASGQPVRIIVPYAAGGLVDVLNRIFATRLSQTLGQPVLVENRPGANANIGPTVVIQSPPDGHTLLASSPFLSSNPLIQSNLPWDPKKLSPVVRFAVSPNVLVVPKSSSATTLKELMAQMKAKPGLPIADAGIGSTQSMVWEILRDSAQMVFTPVQYKGGTEYIADLVTGTLGAAVMPINVALGLVKSGDLRALAITSRNRSAVLPDVPTMSEAGFPEASIDSWLGFHVPAGTPPEVVKKLADAVEEATANAEVRSKLANLGTESAYLDTKAFEVFLQADLDRARRLVKLVANNK
jgi:tripartite-type tricarboxylate transporter receptor subunit TctC